MKPTDIKHELDAMGLFTWTGVERGGEFTYETHWTLSFSSRGPDAAGNPRGE